MYMFVVQLLTVYSVCSYITCQGQDVFLTRVLPSSLVCGSLCTYTTRCGSFIWDAASSSCHLHTGGDTGNSRWGMMQAQYQVNPRSSVCGSRLCGIHKTCVPVEAGSGHICLGMTPASVASVAATTPTTTRSGPPTATSAITSSTNSPATSVTTPLGTFFQSTTAASTSNTVASTSTTAASTSTTQSATTTTSPAITSASLPTTTPPTSAVTPTSTTATPSTSMPTTSPTTTVSTTSPAASTTTTTATTTKSYTCAVTSQSVNNNECGTYLGCYMDDWSRVLPDGHLVDRTTMTTETCMLNCYGNYTHFGVEDGSECFCGDVIKTGYTMKADNECSARCSGNRGTGCGGPWRISIYRIVP
ncbi:uncharacterized protein [Haliotis cracherodii]|uniref:uncharacterized protein n=1 Tax=Haliotis cracherodii TaxID=6455 RepID=UPI0039E980B3